MINILITGKDSYIGTSFEKWMKQFENYRVDTISTFGDSWKNADFSKYDVIFHVAGIAHVKETKQNASLYYKVNRDLTYQIARKAKDEGVNQFIFLSTMSVYGINSGVISIDTPPNPKTHYGRSKLEAEELLLKLSSDDFIISIIRAPMVYGKGCKGNFQTLKSLALKIHFFPYILNRRSMIYIENLCAFLQAVIDSKIKGVLFPQNGEYVCTSSMVKAISNDVVLIKGFGWLIRLLLKNNIVAKVFGDLTYEKSMSIIDIDYNVCDFEESIKRSI